MKRILLIEDDTIIYDIMIRQLKGAGFEVLSCRDGAAGLEMAKNEKPDLVLLDYILPGMNGPEIYDRLKTDPVTKSIPVMMLSNVGNKDEIKRMLDQGVKRYLVKYNNSLEMILKNVIDVIEKGA